MLFWVQGIDRDIEIGKYMLLLSASQDNEYVQRFLNNYGRTPISLASFRLLASLAHMFQNRIEQEQKQQNSNLIDRKLRQKIEEKKQAQGLKMG